MGTTKLKGCCGYQTQFFTNKKKHISSSVPWTSVQEKLAMVQPEKTKKGDVDGLLQSLSSQTISAQVKCDVMQKAVETCPKFNMVSSS